MDFCYIFEKERKEKVNIKYTCLSAKKNVYLNIRSNFGQMLSLCYGDVFIYTKRFLLTWQIIWILSIRYHFHQFEKPLWKKVTKASKVNKRYHVIRCLLITLVWAQILCRRYFFTNFKIGLFSFCTDPFAELWFDPSVIYFHLQQGAKDLLGQDIYPCPIRLLALAQRSMTIAFTYSRVSPDFFFFFFFNLNTLIIRR